MSTEPNVVQRAIDAAGGQAKLARLVGVKQQSVGHWLHNAKRIPAERVVAVSAATGIPLHELRPDLFRAPQPAEAAA